MEGATRQKILLEIVRQFDQKDITSVLADYKVINNFLGDCMNELHTAKITITFWQEYFETHLFKFNLLNSSLIQEFEGIEIPGSININHKKTYNLSALYLLGRSQLETFFIIKYLYLNIKSDEHGAFRYFLYEYGGLCTRQEYPATTVEHKAKKNLEKKRIEDLKGILQTNEYFKSLPSHKQKAALNSKQPKEIGWTDIIKESGLDDAHHMNWRFYSNYAHSEFIEAMQLKNFFLNPQNIVGTCFHTLTCFMMFPSMLIISLTDKYPVLKELFNAQSIDLKTKIEIWNIFGLEHTLPEDI